MSHLSRFVTRCDSHAGRRWRYWLLLALTPALALLCRTTPVRAEAPDAKPAVVDPALDNEPADYLRFVDDKHGGGKLEVAEGTYKNDSGVTVHLVGAVHIGEKQYYDGLNKEFEKFDALLYEMVKPANMGAPVPNAKAKSAITMFQRFLKDQLDLDYQLDDIDYSKPNFVHADLDAETFEKMQEERGESMLGLMLGQMLNQFGKQLAGGGQADNGPQGSLEDLVNAFNSPDRTRQFKLILGRSFTDVESMEGTVLVTERNKKALSVLKDTIRSGKKDIGIFYGAAHMHDMESRLALMGFKRTGLKWRTAWDMTAPAAGANDKN
jgi:hypothetical protein